MSHTGSLAGRYEFYKPAFLQAGVITVDSITELIDVAKALALQPPSPGKRVAIFSSQAGPGIIMADKCQELGLRLAEFSPATKQRLSRVAPSPNIVENPVDLAWASWDFNVCQEMLKIVLEDDGVDAVTTASVYFPTNMKLLQAFGAIAKRYQRPITICLDSPGGLASAGLNALDESGVPTYPLPERAVTGLAGLVRYGEILSPTP